MKFPCKGCGACCRRIGAVPQHMLDQHGLTADKNGHCIHLDGNNCTIYAMRPEICRVTDNYRINATLCNEWMAQDGFTDFITIRDLESAVTGKA